MIIPANYARELGRVRSIAPEEIGCLTVKIISSRARP
jgi:hypothetical protein